MSITSRFLGYCWRAICISGLGAGLVSVAAAAEVRVTIRNLAPQRGTFLTPVWVGFHDGSFDLYDAGAAASAGIERIAEDGDTAALMGAFTAAGAGTVQATITGAGSPPVLDPQEVTAMDFSLDANAAASRYFSYASMIIPSNDAFVANGNPTAFPIFDGSGNFTGADFIVLGSMVRDAGTEVNDELPANTAFFGQATPDTGVAENGTIHDHVGFKPAGSGGILDSPTFSAGNFLAAGYQVAHVTVTLVPEPSSFALAVAAGVVATSLLWRRGRRGQSPATR